MYLGKVSCIKIMVVKLPVLKYVIIPYAIFYYSIFAFSPYFFEHLNHIPYSLTCMFWSKPHVRKSAKSKYRWTWSYTKWWENVKHVLLRNSWRHVNLSTLEITFCHFSITYYILQMIFLSKDQVLRKYWSGKTKSPLLYCKQFELKCVLHFKLII